MKKMIKEKMSNKKEEKGESKKVKMAEKKSGYEVKKGKK
jgi:hypothetical protein